MKFVQMSASLLLAAAFMSAGQAIPVSAADSPENLDIVWARTDRERTPVYAQASVESKVVKAIKKGEIIHLVGERQAGGETWYEVASYGASVPLEGWIRRSDTWFSDVHDLGFFPTSHQLYSRMQMKLARYLGSYPERSRTLLGRELDSRFARGDGTAIHTLTWRGLRIVYENSYKRADGAWITFARVTAGSTGDKVSFGPIRIGSTLEDVMALRSSLGWEYKYMNRNVKIADRFDVTEQRGETVVTLGIDREGSTGRPDDPYSFTFYIRDGKVVCMEYRYGYTGE